MTSSLHLIWRCYDRGRAFSGLGSGVMIASPAATSSPQVLLFCVMLGGCFRDLGVAGKFIADVVIVVAVLTLVVLVGGFIGPCRSCCCCWWWWWRC